jgi:hypothetical protein
LGPTSTKMCSRFTRVCLDNSWSNFSLSLFSFRHRASLFFSLGIGFWERVSLLEDTRNRWNKRVYNAKDFFASAFTVFLDTMYKQ